MGMKHAGNYSQEAGDKAVNAAGNARRRSDTAKQALAGAETVVAFEDSSGNAIANASPLSMDEREAAKKRLQK